MHNLKCKFEGSGKLIVKRNGVIRAVQADDNMILDGFFSKMLLTQPHLEVKATIKTGMGYNPTEPTMVQLQDGLGITNGLWPTAYLTPDGLATVVGDELVVRGFFNFTFARGQLVGPLAEYGIDLDAIVQPDNFDVDTRLVILSEADIPAPITLTAEDQLLISYRINLKISLVQPGFSLTVSDGVNTTNHLAHLVLLEKGNILDYLNILGSTPQVGSPTEILVSPEYPVANFVDFDPQVKLSLGNAEIVVTDNGVHVPIKLTDAQNFPTGIRAIYPSGASWYAIVVTPGLEVKSGATATTALYSGAYEPLVAPVVIPKATMWRLVSNNMIISMPMSVAYLGPVIDENDEVQCIIGQNCSGVEIGYMPVPHNETGLFPMVKASNSWGSAYINLGFAHRNLDFANWKASSQAYKVTAELKLAGKTLRLDVGTDSNGNVVVKPITSSGVLGPELTGIYSATFRKSSAYAGIAIALPMFDTVDKLFGAFDIATLDAYYGGDYPEKTRKYLLGHGEVAITVENRTTGKKVAIRTPFSSMGEVSVKGGWKHNQSTGKYLDSEAFDSSANLVTTTGDLQMTIVKHVGGVVQDDPTVTANSRVKVHVGIGMTAKDLLADYDYYLMVSARTSPCSTVTLKAVNVGGELQWVYVNHDGVLNFGPENFTYTESVAGKVWDTSFFVDEFMPAEVGDFDRVPGKIGNYLQLGDFAVMVYARPKNSAFRAAVIDDNFTVRS